MGADALLPFKALIKEKAGRHDLPAEWLGAICLQESAGDPFALRYEPGFYERYIHPLSLTGRTPQVIRRVRSISDRSSSGTVMLKPEDVSALLDLAGVFAEERQWLEALARHLQLYGRAELIHTATEARTRAFSWGLGQVMGQVAREQGFDGEYLAALCDPESGLEHLCRLFLKMLNRYGNIPDAVSAYNQGNIRWRDFDHDGVRDPEEPYRNQSYVDGVTRFRDVIQDSEFFE